MAKKTTRNPYGIHPGVQMVQDWIASLKEKTGRTLDQWLSHIRRSGPKGEAARRDWLKTEYGLGTNAAWWLAERAEGKGQEDGDPQLYLKAALKYVDEMFAGSKAGLRPIYDELLKVGLGLGKDVKACPCQTMVPIFRRHVIAQIKPATRTRIDFGLCLTKHKGKVPKRLLDTGGKAKGDRITHRIEVTSIKDIDAELKKWLRTAYELDASA